MFAQPPFLRGLLNRPAAVALLVALVAFAVRALYVVAEWKLDLVMGEFLSGDGHLYDALATNLTSGKGYSFRGHPTAHVVPGYPLWLAFWYSVVGRDHLFIGLVQAALGGVACALVFDMGRRIFGVAVGLLAGMICALLPELVLWTSGQILTEPLYVFLVTTAVYFLVRAIPAEAEDRRPPPLWPALAAGVFIGLAALTRPVALTFGAVACLYLWRKASLRSAVLVGTAAVALMLPWAYRNHRVMGAPLLTSTDAGWVLYLYHNPHGTSDNGGYDPHIARPAAAAGLSELEARRYFQREAVRYALAHPLREVELSARRFWNMWRPTYAGSSARNYLLAYLTYLPLVSLAFLGLLTLRFREPRVGLLTLFVLYHLVFHLLVAAELRFRFPMEPVLSLFAAATLAYLFRSFFPIPLRTAPPVAASAADRDSASAPALRVSVIVPAYNEAGRIEGILRRIREVPVEKEVIVVNDGSTDGTGEVLSGLGGLYDRRCDLCPNHGKGAAVLAGLAVATGDVVLVQDADGELDPAEYPRLLAPFARGAADVVFGSRFLPGGSLVRRSPVPRVTRFANWVLTGVTNALFAGQLTDMETGFKVCRADLMRALALRPSRYELEPEVAAKLLRRNVPIVEVPVSYFPRPRHEKLIGVRDGISAMGVLFRLRVRSAAGSSEPAILRRIRREDHCRAVAANSAAF